MARLSRDRLVLLLLVVLGAVFLASKANLQLASDDLAWLQGEAPTVFDQYRTIPRFFFALLHALFGPSAVAALVMILFFHSLNGWLTYHLGRMLGEGSLASLSAAAVLLINPITLSTLTWISCFSYVLGTALGLLALWTFCRGSGVRARTRFLWSGLSLICFAAGLFCSHEVFFLPVMFMALGWLRGEPARGAILLLLGMASALLVNACVYDFGRYGVEASRLFSFDFALAYASSGLSSGLALGLAYPLSFFARPLNFLRACFSEPLRWGLTAIVLGAGIGFSRSERARRLYVALALCFLACISPYIIRLYLTPDTVNYHISYALSGRVFYLPFAVVALAGGKLVSGVYGWLRGQRWVRLLWLAPVGAYVHALWLYDRADFLGLKVAQGVPEQALPRWNPFASQQPAWVLLVVLAAILAALARRQIIGSRVEDRRSA